MQRTHPGRPAKYSSFAKSRPQIPHIISRQQVQSSQPLSKHNYQVHQSGVYLRTMGPSLLPTRSGANRRRDERASTAKMDTRERQVSSDDIFNEFLASCREMRPDSAIEHTLKSFLKAKEVVFWQEVPQIEMFYSPTLNLTTTASGGLVSLCLLNRGSVRVANPTNNASFKPAIDGKVVTPDSTVLLVPIWNDHEDVCAVIEVVRNVEFDDNEVRFGEWFAKKLRLMSQWINLPGDLDSLTLDVLGLLHEEQYRNTAFQKVASYFDCRSFEVWLLERNRNRLTRYDATTKKSVSVLDAGIILDVLTHDRVINVANCKISEGYNQVSDGDLEESVLAVPVKDDNNVYAVVLRGSNHTVFTRQDYEKLKKAAPHMLLGLANSEAISEMESDNTSTKIERESLQALLEVVEILNSQLDADKLPAVITEKGRTLTNSDRCSLFVVNENRDHLITYLHTGLDESIEMPIDKGIAGQTVMQQKVYKIANAYESDVFDPSIDKASGYRTKSILSVPIVNTRGECIGCTEMMNKLDGQEFTEWDVKVIQIFNVFCGIALENAKLYKKSKDMAHQLHGLFDTAFSMSKTEDIHKMLSDIMQNAKKSIGAERASFFIHDNIKQELTSFIVDGDKLPGILPMDRGLAAKAVKTRTEITENDCYTNPDFNRDIDKDSGYRTKSLIAVPIIDSKNEVMGVVEVLNKTEGEFDKNDSEILRAFTTFASVALENSRLKDIAKIGNVESELMKWITPAEREAYGIPKALELTEEQKKTVNSMACFAVDFKGIGHFKEMFYFFQSFNFFQQFKITSERFFKFLDAVSSRYTDTSYHNWTHACDVTQCVVFQMKTGKIDEKYDAWEMFTLLVASVCHDTNHRGFNNVFNVKAETPLGILFKDQSVMEMHHVTEAIPIISRDDIQLFQAFDQNEVKKVWTLFIKLILATDMARHFDLVKGATAALDENRFDFKEPDLRLLGLQLLLKVADISNVARPFEIADKWCDILNEEFFHQGDLEKSTGIGLTSPLNDRDTANKPKSQIGFYNFICLPLYTLVARLYPELECNVEQLKSNLERWKELVAQQAPPPAPA